ncbi:hypothetical protein [Actinomadura citrea]|jgi:hypothetical protein|uniref:Uncharacterized protein n=1 Tax=Actinomadura citrea TaxID=46158 RepID=A0A7Y9G784_9ACTN|nr:hypothetical protein [Actinomadura citrea]NYE11208.1 hypothetical protein [Actinomadura citrea]GGT77914.1 hypothetical protein GCM10010177_40410 [Actinomadura citrea]
MRKGICRGRGVVRLMLGLVAVGAIVMLVKEVPALRRYVKAESM